MADITSVSMQLLYRKAKEKLLGSSANSSNCQYIPKTSIKQVLVDYFSKECAQLTKEDIEDLNTFATEKIEEYITTAISPSFNKFSNFMQMEIRNRFEYMAVMANKRNQCKQTEEQAPIKVASSEKILGNSDARKSTNGKSTNSKLKRKDSEMKEIVKISMMPNKFYNMRFYSVDNHEGIKYDKPSHQTRDKMLASQEQIGKALKYESIINWPNVRITFRLPHLEFIRNCNYNMAHYLSSDTKNVDVERNQCNELFFSSLSLNKSANFHVPLVATYLRLVEKCLNIADIPEWSRQQIRYFIDTMIQDFERLEVAYCNVNYSYHTTKYNYYRVFENPRPSKSDDHDKKDLHMVETINPEVVFKFQKCAFSTNMSESDENQLFDYFNSLIRPEPNPANLKELTENLRKSITYQCTMCYKQFSGAMAFQMLIDHIVTHTYDKRWVCSACKKKYNQLELALEKGAHKCDYVRK